MYGGGQEPGQTVLIISSLDSSTQSKLIKPYIHQQGDTGLLSSVTTATNSINLRVFILQDSGDRQNVNSVFCFPSNMMRSSLMRSTIYIYCAVPGYSFSPVTHPPTQPRQSRFQLHQPSVLTPQVLNVFRCQ